MAKIYLNPGHGGRDAGACDYGRKEKDDVLLLALDVGEILEKEGHEVRYSRTDDSDVYMVDYVPECNTYGADLFVSIHRNAFYRKAKGYETCIYADEGRPKVLADLLNEGMEAIGFVNRGSKLRPDLFVLNSTDMDAVLLEVGFIDSEEDNQRFDFCYDVIVDCIASSILKTLEIDEYLPDDTEMKTDLKDLGSVDCIYQAYTDQWWPPVKNYEDWAGEGDDIPIRYLGICVSRGYIRARAFTKDHGWLPFITFGQSYDINDFEYGVIGDGSPMEAIELCYDTPDGESLKRVVYAVSSVEGDEFYPVQYDDETTGGQDGYAGVKGIPVDKFKAWIV